MQQRYGDIRALGGEVLAISFAPPERVAAYVTNNPLPFPVLADPNLEGYRAFELGRTSWIGMMNPLVLLKYMALMFKGWLPGKPAGKDDLLQLGGDFVIDGRRRLVYAYRSVNPTDRPTADALVHAVRQAVSRPS